MQQIMEQVFTYSLLPFLKIAMPLYVLYKIVTVIKKKKVINEDTNKASADCFGIYHKRRLITANEEKNYQAILEAATTFNLKTFSKVRLIDIINTNDPKNNSAINKIIRKHVDFLLCDNNFMPICVIEIDDSSHNSAKARYRDEVKNNALKDAGVQIIRTKSINKAELETMLKSILVPLTQPKQNLYQEESNETPVTIN